jgi:hypothetical protein
MFETSMAMHQRSIFSMMDVLEFGTLFRFFRQE